MRSEDIRSNPTSPQCTSVTHLRLLPQIIDSDYLCGVPVRPRRTPSEKPNPICLKAEVSDTRGFWWAVKNLHAINDMLSFLKLPGSWQGWRPPTQTRPSLARS